ncbi:MAG: alpha/beta hydrolase [Magnetococcales bacterium]|nr:alpha/beta hydrolase [Magnetococcales bacterium]MBF0117065.1 alpha/beta hydrolase [Magnetococcales bacterium]
MSMIVDTLVSKGHARVVQIKDFQADRYLCYHRKRGIQWGEQNAEGTQWIVLRGQGRSEGSFAIISTLLAGDNKQGFLMPGEHHTLEFTWMQLSNEYSELLPRIGDNLLWSLESCAQGFRIFHIVSKRWMYGSGKDHVGLIEGSFEDQYWHLAETQGSSVAEWIAQTLQPEKNAPIPERHGGFRCWQIGYDEAAGPSPFHGRKNALVRKGMSEYFNNRASGSQHLLVFIHGVDTSFNPFVDYISCLDDLYQEYLIDQHGPVKREDISVLGINWGSQTMLTMLSSLLKPSAAMPAKLLAENALPELIHLLADTTARPTIHFVAHSMGSQVLMYLLQQLNDKVNVGSMLFFQGFAPSSAFAAKQGKSSALVDSVTGVVEGHLNLNGWLYPVLNKANIPITIASNALYYISWGIAGSESTVNLGKWIHSIIHGFTDNLLCNIIKETDFHTHLHKVSGPILATTTSSLLSDYQVGAAEATFYSAPGVLGVRGFVGDDVEAVAVHDVTDDALEEGAATYSFSKSDIKFYNLLCWFSENRTNRI